ncbi:hypothetical protein [Rathayibacter rathayi]|uniref:Uncharacterized protein n=1 Tax=Rathayibacter rathayi TaxID=33887 RepID=A0ABX5A8T9_RATRA|nr:hypothetical protein [Rathayibacter rathayi]PPH73265.1 hypothetical protein C5C40_13900 [Rathayibacter rathayi]
MTRREFARPATPTANGGWFAACGAAISDRAALLPQRSGHVLEQIKQIDFGVAVSGAASAHDDLRLDARGADFRAER